MKKWEAPRIFDLGILLLGAALVGGSAFWAYRDAPSRDRLVIQGASADWTYPLDADEVVRVEGPLGDTLVEIRGGGARVVSSPCSNQTCAAAGEVRRRGQWAACLPNGVLLRVEGEAGIDAEVW